MAATESHSRREGGLLRELDLANSFAWWAREAPNAAWAIRYGNLFEDVKRFLDASQKAEEDQIAREQARERQERRRLRKSRTMFAGLSAVVFVLFIVAYLKGDEARDAVERANRGFVIAIATSLGQNAGTVGE